LAERDDRDGVGSMDMLKDEASSRRVEFISALSRLKGFSMSVFSFSRRAVRDGMVALSRTSESWKSVETLTSWRLLREGIENWGMEMLTPMRLVAL
jgi:hypothetical protein